MPKHRKPLFISIRIKMLLTFFTTFTIIAVVEAFFYITLTMGFSLQTVEKSIVDLLQTTGRGINKGELAALVQEGQATPQSFSVDPRYIKLMDWLDTIHQVYPAAWPYVFVMGQNENEIIYVADLSARYAAAQTRTFLQTGLLNYEDDELLTGDIYLQGVSSSFVNYKKTWGKWITFYGLIRDDQNKIIGGVGIDYENSEIRNMGQNIIELLAIAFTVSVIIMLVVGLRFGSVFSKPISRLTQAAEKISVGDHKAGLKQLQHKGRPRLFIDEVDRLAEAFRKLVHFQHALYTISAAANTSGDLHDLYALTHQEVSNLVQADLFTIALYDEKSSRISLIQFTKGIEGIERLSAAVCKEYSPGKPPDLTAYLIQTGKSLSLSRQEIKKLASNKVIGHEPLAEAWLGVPLQINQKPFGALIAQSNAKGALFSENDKTLLSFIADQLAMVVKRRTTEAELRQSYQLMEQRVQDRTKDLQDSNLHLTKEVVERHRTELEMQKAKETAEAASVAKSAFLANMSHELRTPLNAILGFSSLMAHDPNLSFHHKEDLEIIQHSGEHLLELINDVLEMSKIEAGRAVLTPAPFDLHHMLKNMEEFFQAHAVEKGLSLIFDQAPDLPHHVKTDEKKLRQVLLNLLSNAVKFTEQGGITVRTRLKSKLPHREARLGFEIEDTGPGIASDQLKDLFNYFVQTEVGQKSQEGTGLGLSISRNFVHMMGGEINISSDVGKGSIFSFDILVHLSQANDIAAQPRLRRAIGLEPNQSTWRILVAEDRDANRRLLLKLLQPFTDPSGVRGFQVREAVNGRQAVAVWEEWSPHLIFMDMRMPELDGHEATQFIRASSKGQATVIVALTASAFEEDRKLILSEGINDFIRKPFKEHEIFDVLNRHLGVKFVFADDTPTKPATVKKTRSLSAEEMSKLSPAWLHQLQHAAAAADGEKIQELLENIRPQYPLIARSLEGLALQYRFDLILNTIPTAAMPPPKSD
jgi:two-component system sensor histidine kinase/response regulator